jgi:putative transposase
LKLVHDATADAVGESEPSTIELDELCRLAAKEMPGVALAAERRAYLDAHADELDATGHRLVVANGYARPRVVTTGAGAVEVTAPRVDDRREDRRFTSAILVALDVELPPLEDFE